jgi:hypothetical protein
VNLNNKDGAMRKRKNIKAKVRWDVFKRDQFRCVYCGSQENLVIDHGDPFAHGGEDDVANFVTACRLCNAGKRDSAFLPKEGGEDGVPVVRKGVEYANEAMADWGVALSHAAMWISRGDTHKVQAIGGPQSADVKCDFVMQPLHFEYPRVNVVIVPLRDKGTYPPEEQARIRNAVILGYQEPTLILMGSPWHFFGVMVVDRHKGIARGFKVDGYLDELDEVYGSGWCPDETWDFCDPREEFNLRPHRIEYCGWHMTYGEAYEEVKNDL